MKIVSIVKKNGTYIRTNYYITKGGEKIILSIQFSKVLLDILY